MAECIVCDDTGRVRDIANDYSYNCRCGGSKMKYETLKELSKKADSVNTPAHYSLNEQGIECIDAIQASMGADEFKGMLKGNVLKYLWRYNYKGKPEQDLRKAEWYLQRLIREV
tara:strand:- start:339 stop:680 length:342 start_codon:yes stop_codon:yes gene_type:complete